jgi:hypothetical protein
MQKSYQANINGQAKNDKNTNLKKGAIAQQQ